MRTFVGAVVVAAIIVAVVAIVVPLIARPVVVAAVRGGSPFGDAPLDVDVDLNVFGLLAGTVDRVHVRGTDLHRGDATVGALDITFLDVATSGRAFRDMAGSAAAISFPIEAGGSLALDTVTVAGSSSSATAVATMDHAAAVRLVESAFADAGVEVSGVELGNGTVVFQVLGVRAEVPIGVEDGAIVLVNPFGTGSFEVVTPKPDDAWQLTGVVVTPGGMTIDATLDVERLLAAS